jgi:hypothetical protein
MYSQKSDLERFWAPLCQNDETIQICVGQPLNLYALPGPLHKEVVALMGAGKNPALTARDLLPVEKHFLFVGDSLCFANIAAMIHANGGKYRFRGGALTPYSELRGSPVVLIGAYNNEWTMRLTKGLRFYFDGLVVMDRQKPGTPVGVSANPPSTGSYEDYAIVTRMQEPSTERPIVAAAGVSHKGTLTAGEFVSNASYMREAVRSAPRDWYRKNIQFVLRLKIVGDTPGPPSVVAMHFW